LSGTGTYPVSISDRLSIEPARQQQRYFVARPVIRHARRDDYPPGGQRQLVKSEGSVRLRTQQKNRIRALPHVAAQHAVQRNRR
jgi:hypothetical protein